MMNKPNSDCRITIYCNVNPSEDPTKLKKALLNILQNIKIQITKDSIKATSENLETLMKIYEIIHLRKTQRIYKRILRNNMKNNTTWFYLNKQAAFVDTVVLCDNADESPLGPIKVILTSSVIEDIVDWLVLTEE